jgi:hypothetical protein
MEAKYFSNLNSNYRTFLNKIDELVSNIDKNSNYILLDNIHNSIELIAKELEIYTNDINRILVYCTNTHPTIKKLKDFTYLKNIKLVEKAIKDEKYKLCLNKLLEECNKKLKKQLILKDIETQLIILWNKYFTYWNGFWKYIIHEKGRIKKVEFIDPTDIDEFIKLF